MIKWIYAKEEPFPKDEQNYLAIFKGQFCLAAWDEDDDNYTLMWMPNTYTEAWVVDKDRFQQKVTHWAHLVYP